MQKHLELWIYCRIRTATISHDKKRYHLLCEVCKNTTYTIPCCFMYLKPWNFLSFVNATILIVSVFPIQLALTFRMTLHTYYKYLTRKMAIIHTSTRILHSKRYRPILCPLLVLMFQHSSSV